jgi:hypothetical protein
MFGWLKRFLSRRRREIFRFHDGTRWRYTDPIVIDREINRVFPEYQTAIKFLEIPEPDGGMPPEALEQCVRDQKRAIEKLVAMVREVFGVKALDDAGNGLTESESLDLLTSFILFSGELATAAAPLSNSPGPVAPSCPPAITGSSAECTSGVTASASSTLG